MRAGRLTRARHSKVGREGQAGVAMIEFTLVALLLFIILFGIAEFGIMMNKYLTLTQLARDGARSLALGMWPPEVEARMIEAAKSLGIETEGDSKFEVSLLTLDPATGAVREPGQEQPGDHVKVTASYSYKAIIGGLFKYMTGTPDNPGGTDQIALSAPIVMRREAPYTDVPEPKPK